MERFSIEKGATIDFHYDPSSIIDNSQEDKPLPFVVQTLTQITVDNGVDDTDQAAKTEFEYYGGLYDYAEREFQGFECAWAAARHVETKRSSLYGIGR